MLPATHFLELAVVMGWLQRQQSRTPQLREPIKYSGEGAEQHRLSEAQEVGLAGETPLPVYIGE